jgi:DNA mismatch endonuclease (patch repair protein)
VTDVVDKATRSRMMAGIRGTNTRPEFVVRKIVHRLGYRFRLHDAKLPGKPDLVLARHSAVIFVHGCFWHGHGCSLFKWPSTRQAFWQGKISGNKDRDVRTLRTLRGDGWRILVVWECALKGPSRLTPERLALKLDAWLRSKQAFRQIRGA